MAGFSSFQRQSAHAGRLSILIANSCNPRCRTDVRGRRGWMTVGSKRSACTARTLKHADPPRRVCPRARCTSLCYTPQTIALLTSALSPREPCTTQYPRCQPASCLKGILARSYRSDCSANADSTYGNHPSIDTPPSYLHLPSWTKNNHQGEPVRISFPSAYSSAMRGAPARPLAVLQRLRLSPRLPLVLPCSALSCACSRNLVQPRISPKLAGVAKSSLSPYITYCYAFERDS